MSSFNERQIFGPLAQWLEHPAHNRTVLGSSPRGPTFLKTKEKELVLNSLNVIDQYKEMERAKIKEDLARKSFPYSIMMQHVNGDFNISTFIRNGNAFGVERIFYWGKRQWDRRGAVGSHNYKQLDHLKSEDNIHSLREQYRFVAVENNISYPCKELNSFQPQENDLYIFGEESKGIEDWILNICDDYVYIPQFGSVRSLNVGTSSGIVMNYVSNIFSKGIK